MDEREWKEASLSEVCDIIGGGTPKTFVAEYWNGNIPWLSVADFNNDNRHVFITEKTITEQGLKNSSTKLLNTGDLIISARGTVGVLAQLAVPMAFNQSCYGIRAKPMTINDFLYYAIKNIIGQIKANTHGSVFDTITRATFDNLKILLPLLPEQKAIATTLSCLDDKIELNNRINKTLEEIAQAIFKSWFVDFEPFTDGEFKDSELGRIPKGWRVGTISDLGEVIGGSTPSKACPEYYTNNGIAWITPKDLSKNKDKFISKGEIDITELGLKNSSTRLMPKGTVLFSSRAPIGYIAIAKNDITTNQGFKSVVPKNNIGTAYIYYFLKNSLEVIENRATGSTFKEVSGSIMKQIPTLIPKDNVLLEFKNICGKYFEYQAFLEEQNRNLANIRDTLLPKLMSGEIRVPIEEVITDKQG